VRTPLTATASLARTAGSGARAAWARASGGRFPLAVSWRLTNRCNRRCRYCDIWEETDGELAPDEALALVDQLADAGVLRVSLSGGEPLLRDDFDAIVGRLLSRGLDVSVNTNGTYLPKHVHRLDRAVRVTLSFDGPADVHDAVRGADGHAEVTRALGMLRERGVQATLTTVLTERNVDRVDEVLAYMSEWGARVLFQPGTLETLGQARENPTVSAEAAYVARYRQAIDRLVTLKRGMYRRFIVNSEKGLYHLRNWPDPTPIPCYVGRLYARVEANGDIYPCGWKRVPGDDRPVNVREHGFEGAFRGTALTSCEQCWCQTTVELNYALDGDLPTLLNLLGY